MERFVRWAGAAVVVAVVLTAVVVFVLWLRTDSGDDRARLAQLGGMLVAAEAAAGAWLAAQASQTAANASADTAREARRALAYHFPPGGYFRTWSQYDDADHARQFGVDVTTLDARVVGQFLAMNHAENIRLWYMTEGCPEWWDPVDADGPTFDLPGVTAQPRDMTDEAQRQMGYRARTNLMRWRAECYQTQGRATWEAVSFQERPGVTSFVQEWKLKSTE